MPLDVLLLRSADDTTPDRYVDACRVVGLVAACAPVLAFTFPHQDDVRRALSRRARYAGLVVTSPRAVEAVRRGFDAAPDCRDAWADAPAFAVGAATAAAVREVGLVPRGHDAGSATELARVITASSLASERLLFLCGNRRRDALPDALRAAHVDVDEVEAYVTTPRTDLTIPDGVTWLAFFSPSGIEAVRQSDVDASAYRVAAIGPTTAAALRNAGIPVDAVAEVPRPDALAAAMKGEAGGVKREV